MSKTETIPAKKLTIRLTERQYEILLAVAKAEQRSVNMTVTRMINIYSKMYHSGVVKTFGDKNDG